MSHNMVAIFLFLLATGRAESKKLDHNYCRPLNIHSHHPSVAVAPGTTVRHICHAENGPYQYRIANFPEEFLVYPTTYYTCQKNGTWSGVGPPICVNRVPLLDNASNFVEENPQCNHCTESTCSETEDWVVIGNKYQSRDGNARDDDQNYETQRVMCVFEQYIYLSSMTFNLPGNSATSQLESFATIKVDPMDVIHDLSDEAYSLVANHCSSLMESNEKLRNGSQALICHLSAYTRRAFLELKLRKENTYRNDNSHYQFMWNSAPIFHSVRSLNTSVTYDMGNPSAIDSFSMKEYEKPSLHHGNEELSVTSTSSIPRDVEVSEQNHFDIQFVEDIPTCDYCTDDSCIEADDWPITGSYQWLSMTDRAPNSEIQRVMCKFDRPTNLSFMTFDRLLGHRTNKSGEFSVKIKIDPNDVLMGTSLHDDLYSRMFRKDNVELRNGSRVAIYNLMASTRKVYLEFNVNMKENRNYNKSRFQFEWFPRPKFYSIIPFTLFKANETENSGCKNDPIIINGIISSRSVNGQSVTLGCRENFTLVDPVTNQSTNGVLTCENQQWSEPVPVCRPDVENGNATTSSQQDKRSWRTKFRSNKMQLVTTSSTPGESTHKYEGINYGVNGTGEQLLTSSGVLEENVDGSGRFRGGNKPKMSWLGWNLFIGLIVVLTLITIIAVVIEICWRFLSDRQANTKLPTEISCLRLCHKVTEEQTKAITDRENSHVVAALDEIISESTDMMKNPI